MATIKATAHQDLWGFLAEISEEVMWQPALHREAVLEVFGAMVYYLHPAYNFEYICALFPIALEVLGLSAEEAKATVQDEAINQRLTDIFVRVVSERIKINPKASF